LDVVHLQLSLCALCTSQVVGEDLTLKKVLVEAKDLLKRAAGAALPLLRDSQLRLLLGKGLEDLLFKEAAFELDFELWL